MRRVAILVLLALAAIVSPAQTFTKLVDFDGSNGSSPEASLVLASDGNFYGTTAVGGTKSSGTAFKMTPEGMLTTLYSFCVEQDCSDGGNPMAGLVQATDGNFYGTTFSGGTSNNCQIACGTVFKITPGGTLTTLHSFEYSDGAFPLAGLVQATDGNFYGTTGYAGSNYNGTVFKITPAGVLTTLHNFDFNDGGLPFGTLVQATDGNFYSTTYAGGAYGYGTVYKITPEGVLTTLYNFNSGDGANPEAGVVQGTDGNFYGTTFYGGLYNDGTVFKITPAGVLTTLHSFCTQGNCADGAFPQAALVQAADGNFYGTTHIAGANNAGTIFRITPEGTLVTLHSFEGSDGSFPVAGLAQGADGNLYGTAYLGGANDDGTVFRLVAYAPLSVAKSGMGTIISGDGHIYCGTVCSFTYDGGTQVGLTAIPAPGYTFSNWTGCDNAQGNFCTMMMSSAKDVTATFTVSNVGLTSLVLNPSSVKGGNISIATISLNAPAPPGGLGVGVATNSPLAVHPPSLVLIPEGRTSFSFAVRTSVVRMTTVANVIASAGTSQVNATLTVTTGYGSSQAPSSEPQR